MTDTPAKRPRRPSPPSSLGAAGRDLWRAVHAETEFDAHEVPVVVLACRQADDVARLEELLAEQGPTVIGSTGQERLNPAFGELRQARLAVAKILAGLPIPDDEDDRPMTDRQRRAQHAANSRWAHAHAMEGGRRGATPAAS